MDWKTSVIGSETVKDMRRQGIGGNISIGVGVPMNYDRRNDEETG